TVSPSAALPETSLPTRSRISRAALLVNVIAAIFAAGRFLRLTRCAIFSVITRVLPDPAPASTSRGPSQYSTAARCWGLSTGNREWRMGNGEWSSKALRPTPGTTGYCATLADCFNPIPYSLFPIPGSNGQTLFLLFGDERRKDHHAAAER